MSNKEEKDCNSSDDEDLVNIIFLCHAHNTLSNNKKKKRTYLEAKVDSQAIELGGAFEKAA